MDKTGKNQAKTRWQSKTKTSGQHEDRTQDYTKLNTYNS